MKMYHVSLDIFKNIEVFVPRIPKSRMKNEDSTTPRVCISNSLENCLNGLTYMLNYWKFITDDMDTNFSVLDEMCPRILKVYEFEIKSDLVSPEKLDSENLVPDASTTEEYWSLKELIPTRSYLIKIKNIYEDNFKVTKLEYDLIDICDVSKKAEIHFYEADNDIKELFDNKEPESLCYNILEVRDNVVRISTENYPVKKDDLSVILDRYLSWNKNYIKTIVL